MKFFFKFRGGGGLCPWSLAGESRIRPSQIPPHPQPCPTTFKTVPAPAVYGKRVKLRMMQTTTSSVHWTLLGNRGHTIHLRRNFQCNTPLSLQSVSLLLTAERHHNFWAVPIDAKHVFRSLTSLYASYCFRNALYDRSKERVVSRE